MFKQEGFYTLRAVSTETDGPHVIFSNKRYCASLKEYNLFKLSFKESLRADCYHYVHVVGSSFTTEDDFVCF